MKVLICGDRNWTDRDRIFGVINALAIDNPTIIHGGANGADTIADNIASGLGLKTIVHRADWGKYGRAAGPIRNKKMLDEHPILVIAFHDCIERSKGTKHMISIARDAGVRVLVLTTTS